MSNSASEWPGIPQGELSPENRTHIEILCNAFATGPWNISVNWESVDWGRSWTFFPVQIPSGAMATTDNPYLTRLVFAAHDDCVRVQVSAHTFRHVMIGMHSGRAREGGTMSSHPTAEAALAAWRQNHKSKDQPS